jgi:rod shape determining protein RodA
MFDRRLVQNFDWLLLAMILLIAGIGIVNLYSAGYNRTPEGVTPVVPEADLLAGGGALGHVPDPGD